MLTNSGVAGSYSYPTPTSPRPHAVTSRRQSWTYSYDANGNMTAGAGADLHLQWREPVRPKSTPRPTATARMANAGRPSTPSPGGGDHPLSGRHDYEIAADTDDQVPARRAPSGSACRAQGEALLRQPIPQRILRPTRRRRTRQPTRRRIWCFAIAHGCRSAPSHSRWAIRWALSCRDIRRDIRRDDQATSVDPPAETFWLHRDHQGSIQAITDATGAEVQRFQYYPYGDRLNTATAHDESKGWIGERQDTTGLFYLHARYYDPVIGRFVTPDWLDPMDPRVGPNRYAYSLNNPVMYVDPGGNARVLRRFRTRRSLQYMDRKSLRANARQFRTVRRQHSRLSGECGRRHRPRVWRVYSTHSGYC